MKRIVVFILILVNTGLVFTQECSPTFKEIYHFNEGDCFIYGSTYWIGPYLDRYIYTSNTTESYIILHRIEQGDTLKYIRKGVRKFLQLRIPWGPGPGSSETDTLSNSTTLFQDSIQYIDSDSNFLNKCEGYLFDVTKILRECSNCQPSGYMTSVKIDLNDSLQTKKAGGDNNFFHIDSAGSITDTVSWPVWGQQIRVEKSYANGLGLIHELYGDDETSRPGNLIAYHKNTAGNPPPGINIVNGNSLIIKTGSTTILRATKNAGYHYQWFRDGSVLKGPSGDTLVVSEPGAYQVLITTDEHELNFSAICSVSVKGLVAWYPFNGNAFDESGHGYDMNMVGAELITDRSGKPNSAYLLGDNDYMSFQKPFLLNPDSALSLVAWTNYAGNEESLITWLNSIQDLPTNASLFIQSLAGKYNDGNWHFFAVIYMDNGISLYTDGDLVKSVPANSSVKNILFGQLQKDPFLPFFKGKIDDIRIFDYALNEQDIISLYGKQNADIDSGLVAWYPFNGNANDESGNGNNAISNNASLTKDRFDIENAAYSFTGQNSRIIIPNDSLLNFNNDFSIGFWMKTNSAKNDLCVLHKAVYGVWTGYMFDVNWTNPGYCQMPGHITSYVACSAFEDACSNDAVNTDKWVFVLSVYNNSLNQTRLYIDGQLQDDIGRRTGPVANDSDLIIGYYFDGVIDDIRMYNRALNYQEVKALYYENPVSVSAALFGDADANSSVQAYDAALTLQYSVGLDPLPIIDPLPWEPWRVASVDVDSVPGVTANDASLILQKAIGLIVQFPVENGITSEQADNADVDLRVENNTIVFYAKGSLFGLNVNSDNSDNTLGTPIVLDNKLILAFNNQNNTYAIGVAAAYSPDENTAILKIPFTSKGGSMTFSMIVNTKSQSVTIDLATGMVEFTDGGIVIYPSPATDHLTIRGIVKSTIAEIYSLNGQLLQTTLLNNPVDDISVSNLPNGSYLIKMQTDKVIAVKRFVKQ